jgi:3-methylcrotonyl-CoA carboxylase alpha subunit
VLRWQVGSTTQVVTLTQARAGELAMQRGASTVPLGASHGQVDRDGDTFDAFTRRGHLTLRWLNPLNAADAALEQQGQLTAPMPGKVVALLVSVGDAVSAGQPVVVTEAMKMEHALCAPRDGRVTELLCREGDQVPEGAELLRIESD